MNAPFVPDLSPDPLSVIRPPAPQPDWSGMASAVNVWRGKCLQEFARVERAVSETLVHLARDTALSSVALPLLVGCRLTELERVLAAGTRPAAAKALPALQAFRAHDRLRILLCHGQANVLRNQKGDWHIAFQLLAFRNGVAAREDCLLARTEIDPLYESIRRDGQRLVSLLAVLRSA